MRRRVERPKDKWQMNRVTNNGNKMEWSVWAPERLAKAINEPTSHQNVISFPEADHCRSPLSPTNVARV